MNTVVSTYQKKRISPEFALRRKMVELSAIIFFTKAIRRHTSFPYSHFSMGWLIERFGLNNTLSVWPFARLPK